MAMSQPRVLSKMSSSRHTIARLSLPHTNVTEAPGSLTPYSPRSDGPVFSNSVLETTFWNTDPR